MKEFNTPAPRFDVFLSHAGPEKREVVSHLHRELAARGLRVFVDYEMTPGTHATQAMLHAAKTVPVAVVVLSLEFFRREWPLKELHIFLERFRAEPRSMAIVPYFYGIAPGESTAIPSEHRGDFRSLSEISGSVKTPDSFDADSVVDLADAIEEHIPPSLRRRTKEQVRLDSFLSTGLLATPARLPSHLVHSSHAVVPFEGRQAELGLILAWATSSHLIRACVIHGPGGVGKTRLLQELCAQLRAIGQRAGFARVPLEGEALRSLVLSDEPTTVVLDYADARGDMAQLMRQVTGLQDAGEKRSSRFRLVLVARTAGVWLSSLRAQSHQAELLLGETDPISLGTLASTAAERQAQFQRATTAFAATRGLEMPDVRPSLEDARYERVLYIHLAALAALLGMPVPVDGLMETVLQHEERAWRLQLPASFSAKQESLIDTLRLMVTVATLRGGLRKREDAENFLRRMKLTGPDNEDDVVMAINWLYPGRPTESVGNMADFAVGLEPDLLGEELVWRVLTRAGDRSAEMLRAVFSDNDETALRAVFAMFARMSSSRAGVEPWISAVLDADVPARGTLAYNTVLALAEDEQLDRRMQSVHTRLGQTLARSLRLHGTDEQAITMMFASPHESMALREVKAWASNKLVDVTIAKYGRGSAARGVTLLLQCNAELSLCHNERAYDLAKEAHQLVRSQLRPNPEGLLNVFLLFGTFQTLGNCLGRIGRHQHSLETYLEAETLLERLLDSGGPMFSCFAAENALKLGTERSALGQREAALTSSTKAVNLYRALAKEPSGIFLANLAASLANLGNHQGALGHHEMALASSTDAVSVFRELARKRPDVYLPDLAASLTCLGARQKALGQHEAALASTGEAVKMRRELVRTRPDMYSADLAGSLSNLGCDQSALGQHEAALASATEAVDLYRGCIRLRPDSLTAELAASLSNLGGEQSAHGLREEALITTSEAVTLYRELALKMPDAFTSNLAACLQNLSVRFFEVGQNENARASAAEAVRIFQNLTLARPNMFKPGLAGSLKWFGMAQNTLGQSEAALQSVSEAVAIYKDLARLRPEVYTADLAASLFSLGIVQVALGDYTTACGSARESIVLIESLAPTRPMAFAKDLCASYVLCGRAHGFVGEHDAAVAAFRAGLGIFAPLALTTSLFLHGTNVIRCGRVGGFLFWHATEHCSSGRGLFCG